jgi:hypothetical protein
MKTSSFQRWLRRPLPWLAAAGLCVGCRKPPPDERVFTGSNGVRPGVAMVSPTGGTAELAGSGGTGAGGATSDYELAALPSEHDALNELSNALFELDQEIEDLGAIDASDSDRSLAGLRERFVAFRRLLQGAGFEDLAERLLAELDAIEAGLARAQASLFEARPELLLDVHTRVEALGDELEAELLAGASLAPPR